MTLYHARGKRGILFKTFLPTGKTDGLEEHRYGRIDENPQTYLEESVAGRPEKSISYNMSDVFCSAVKKTSASDVLFSDKL